MQIIMITASLPPLPSGGAELQALKLAVRLKEKGVSITFLTPGKDAIRGKDRIQGMPVHRLHSVFGKVFEFLARGKRSVGRAVTVIEYDDRKEKADRITRKVGWPTVVYYTIFYYHCLLFLWPRRKNIGIIHAHTMEWSAIVATRLGRALGKPVIIKDSTMNGFASMARYPDGLRLQQMIIANAHFVAMTDAIRKNLECAGVPADKISLIPNGIEVENVPASLSVSAGTWRVLFVGNLYQQPAKGVDVLLKAWKDVAAAYPGALLDIVGDGDLPAYRDYTHGLGIGDTVHFHGRQSNLQGFYASATLFVLPSRREGMSNALMEAMLQGLPCVATDISGNQDLIRTGVNGLLVPATDAGALSNAIAYMLDHPAEAQRMGGKARETIISRSDIRVVAAGYLALYERLLAGAAPHDPGAAPHDPASSRH